VPVLESRLVIGAKDETGSAFSSIKAHIASLDKSIATFDKMAASVGKISKSTDPMLVAINASVRSMNEARGAATELAAGLEKVGGGAEVAAGAQRTFGASIMNTTRLMALQGAEAVKVAETIVSSQKKAERRKREGGVGGIGGGLAPIVGAEGLGKAIEAGATVEDQVAALKAAGATDAEISKAQANYNVFKKTHAGATEHDYLATYLDARVIAPGEAYEMTNLGATYTAGLRNSRLPAEEGDVGNVMRTMDELGLKTQAEREDFVNNILKTQQAFRGQIPTETILSAYRNAKGSIYGWDPNFRNNVLPTLLQSSGEQGGTEIMTAFNNLVGKHMQQSEIRAMASAGFARNQDLVFDKVGNVRGLKPGAKMFEEDTFKKNPYQWSLDLHKEYMQRKGGTEGGFDDLVAKMPRNMSALIEFFLHNQQRIERDTETRNKAQGLSAANDTTLANSPSAASNAVGAAITQFAAEVTDPAVKAAGPALVALAQGIQDAASRINQAAKDHPTAAAVTSTGLIGGAVLGIGAGFWKIGSGIWNKIFGGGGGGAAAGGAGEAVAGGGGGGLLGRLFGGGVAGAFLPGLIDQITDDNRTPGAKANDAAFLDWLKKSIYGPTPSAGGMPEEHHWGPWHAGGSPSGPIVRGPYEGRDPRSPQSGPYSYTPKGSETISVSGQAEVQHEVTVRIEPSPLLTAIVDQARAAVNFTVPLIGGGSGQMDSDAGPHRSGFGIGSR
jgi:hypothetical protein